MKRKLALVALLASSVMGLVHADAVEEGIAKYREMLGIASSSERRRQSILKGQI